jgi:hypothetical protein
MVDHSGGQGKQGAMSFIGMLAGVIAFVILLAAMASGTRAMGTRPGPNSRNRKK